MKPRFQADADFNQKIMLVFIVESPHLISKLHGKEISLDTLTLKSS